MAQITEVKVKLLGGEGQVLALASVTIDGEYVVHGAKYVRGQDGKEFVAMPSRKTGSGEYREVFHPVTKEARDRLHDAVIQAYIAEAAKAEEAKKETKGKKRGRKGAE